MEENLRDLYIKYRSEENKDEILRLYFNFKTNFKFNIDFGNFFVLMCESLDDAPGLEEDINNMYPSILKVFDNFFGLTFIVKEQAKPIPKVEPEMERVLIKIV